MASQESQFIRAALRSQKESAKNRPPLSIAQQRQGMESLSRGLPPDAGITVRAVTAGAVPAEWLIPSEGKVSRVFLYLHGGAYYMGSCSTHRDLAGRLALASDSRALVIGYRLAPEWPFPAALDDAVLAYQYLLDSGVPHERIVVAGDSAGGGLAVSTLVSLRDRGTALPGAAVLMSPWTDLAGTGESMETRSEADPWLDPQEIRAGAGIYLGSADPKNPLASPLYADLHGLPPMLIQVGRDECLLDDSARLAERARAQGTDAALTVWDGMWHVFQAFAAQVPEAREAIGEIGEWVRVQVP